MKITSFASGSTGNAYCVESGGEAILIDCGISCREIDKNLKKCGIGKDAVRAVLFTHNHFDHVKGAATFHKHHAQAAFLANMMTAETIACSCGIDENDFMLFENGQRFETGPFGITAFQIPHDTPDPVGFFIEAEGLNYFHATDVGTPQELLGWYFSKADAATLESNHDSVMLEESARPWSLKRRIAGPRGHLSNSDAAEIIRRHASPRLKALALAHLSSECNEPHLAIEAAKEALAAAGMEGLEPIALPPGGPVAVFNSTEAV